MSKLSKIKNSRENWKSKATERQQSENYLKKELRRVKTERDDLKKILKEKKIPLPISLV